MAVIEVPLGVIVVVSMILGFCLGFFVRSIT